jgi:predicted Zn-dependent protease
MEYPQQRRGVPLTARLLPIAIGLIGVAVFMMNSCVNGPFGRKQLRAIDAQQENKLGLEAFQQVVNENEAKGTLVNEKTPLVAKVREITVKLIKAARREDVLKLFQLPEDEFQWAVEVIQSDQANAFCLPGGKMVVYTGILPIAQTDAALAAVIGHEISHALAHHGAERMGHEKVKDLVMGSVGMGLGDMSPAQRQMVLSAIGYAAQVGGILKYSRDHESEADHMGLILMAAAGYDPREAVEFWTRMSQAGGGGKVPEFLSTHPDHGTRISQLRDWQPEAQQFYANSQKQPTTPLPGIGGGRGFGFK